MKLHSLFFLILISLTIVSANGLQITPNSFTVNKTSSERVNISFILKNEEPNTFQDINFETNSYISMAKVSSLGSGQSINVTALVRGTSSFDGNIRIKGFYNSSLSQLNANHQVDIDYINGFSTCTFSIIKGDSVTWSNLIDAASGTIRLINADTNQEIATINSLQNHTETFTNPITLRYYASRLGLPFTDICTITVLDTTGLINNPELDALLSLNLDINYNPTTLTLSTIQESYTINAGSSTDDILRITNSGTEVARNIILRGDWFSFQQNNFDLTPNESRNIGYTINPVISNSNQTNQTYTKNITITGNFDTLTKEFSIFIPYESGNIFTSSSLTLKELVEQASDLLLAYCNDFPDEAICKQFSQSGFNFLNSTFDENNPLSEQRFKDFLKGYIESTDRNDVALNTLKEQVLSLLNFREETNSTTLQILNIVEEMNLRQEESKDNNYLLIIIILSVGLVGIVSWLIVMKRQENFIAEGTQYV